MILQALEYESGKACFPYEYWEINDLIMDKK